MSLSFEQLSQLTVGRIGEFDLICPECGPGRSTPKKRLQRKLHVWHLSSDFITYSCAHCDVAGYAVAYGARRASPAETAIHIAASKKYSADRERRQVSKAAWLYQQSLFANVTVLTYLAGRGINPPLPTTIRYLPPLRPGHHPAMLVPFGIPAEPEPGVLQVDPEKITGVHLTLLKPDGSDKADVDNPKLTMGSSMGQPLVLGCMNDLLGLAVTEGIEDGLSIRQVTGLGAWAAGTANRMPALSDAVPEFVNCVTVLIDDDDAGRKHGHELVERLRNRSIEAIAVPGLPS